MNRQLKLVWILLWLIHIINCQSLPPRGGLVAQVQKWASEIENDMLTLTEDVLMGQKIQQMFDSSPYEIQIKDGDQIANEVQDTLADYFVKREQDVSKAAVNAYDDFYLKNMGSLLPKQLQNLSFDVYFDSDIPSRYPEPLTYDTRYFQKVNATRGCVKISDQVDRNSKDIIETVAWTSEINKQYIANLKKDNYLKWQYFGSKFGLSYTFPGRPWTTNFVGFTKDYDPRLRPWYIAATSGPKDVVIVIDCGLSMQGNRFKIAKSVAKTVLATLTRNDYVNIVCTRFSHWDETGKWHFYETTVLGCYKDQLIPASLTNRKSLSNAIDNLKAGGTSEMKKGFQKAFKLLRGSHRTGCQSIMIVITDGEKTDGPKVRCSPGYYTRSGFVPGPICRYDWEKVVEEIKAQNKITNPKARIFSYLTASKEESFAGEIACSNQGVMVRLDNTEHLISNMQHYYNYLASSSFHNQITWTAPYLDASGLGLTVTLASLVTSGRNENNETLGVAGIDVTLAEIEDLLQRYEWGTVYSFLINTDGEAIFHPRLKPSSELVDDPIFVSIDQLEMSHGRPKNFTEVRSEMQEGKSGRAHFSNCIRGIPKGDYEDGVDILQVPCTYYYRGITGSTYSFAFNLADSDKQDRYLDNINKSITLPTNFFTALYDYDTIYAKERLPDTYEQLDVQRNNAQYNVPITFVHSTFTLAPRSYCEPSKYFLEGNSTLITLAAHLFANSREVDNKTCLNGANYKRGVRAAIQLTSLLERDWKLKLGSVLRQAVKWVYIGLRNGVFRSYPGHIVRKGYDPVKRPWYLRSLTNPTKIAISTAYLDSAGLGKVITISKAVQEGIFEISNDTLCNTEQIGNLPAGCPCTVNTDCSSKICYNTSTNSDPRIVQRCGRENVEAVIAMDILYSDYYYRILNKLKSGEKACEVEYQCPTNPSKICITRCYLIDNVANIVTAKEFLTDSQYDEAQYNRVTLSLKQPEVMSKLVHKFRVFQRRENIDYQGTCKISDTSTSRVVFKQNVNKSWRGFSDDIPNQGPFPPFQNDYGCIQDVIGYEAHPENLGQNRMLYDYFSGPCSEGFFYFIQLPRTNLFLLVVENYLQHDTYFNINCHIARRVTAAGSFELKNGTCQNSLSFYTKKPICPTIRKVLIPCSFNAGHTISSINIYYTLVIATIVSIIHMI
ncbi:uncharacterized protein TRIADDRAFT_55341 [Trichoplax adhaerens]|uniref:VWFA domain-containing protein n=1 Tax=Trichoplax adhaerens TaxID=10228 RepID=B3RUM1_TRIAD|nr:hypothetical protein TRIADDRAFT_55341 [Trichoplax adhaerens]EDV25350.1 hypothetical protein TRIADDRAFT_55341 [Trichoplax adhaerens]|eukprot:XP_002111383.1 hypothetical protein TRIADDRAFT_55341 [Trichoplax adhaerens]